jgi:hypothetical protein
MNALPSVAQDMPTILKNGRALWLILEAAELRGLPLPFAFRADEVYGNNITLQFWTYDEVVTWAEVLKAETVSSPKNDNTWVTGAIGEWLEVQVYVCTTDGQAES